MQYTNDRMITQFVVDFFKQFKRQIKQIDFSLLEDPSNKNTGRTFFKCYTSLLDHYDTEPIPAFVRLKPIDKAYFYFAAKNARMPGWLMNEFNSNGITFLIDHSERISKYEDEETTIFTCAGQIFVQSKRSSDSDSTSEIGHGEEDDTNMEKNAQRHHTVKKPAHTSSSAIPKKQNRSKRKLDDSMDSSFDFSKVKTALLDSTAFKPSKECERKTDQADSEIIPMKKSKKC
ncbi:hypothetical protein CAEBREN_05472 [Caenorhabditis brenneri]|uniref:Uncharacterized protein n=1 Tax=Caenorhabditis brenneri TaxID=135651 RepID=G0NR13_CAEBE|nr:hypothetical protein CAEBREN_05472 [Caenorhabditis brenneri]